MRTTETRPLVLKVSAIRVSRPLLQPGTSAELRGMPLPEANITQFEQHQGRNLAAKDRGGTSDPVSFINGIRKLRTGLIRLRI
jgi:hypothetical protein